MYYNDEEWTGVNGYGEEIRDPEAYYNAVREDRYGFNSDYTLDQYGKYSGGGGYSSGYDRDDECDY